MKYCDLCEWKDGYKLRVYFSEEIAKEKSAITSHNYGKIKELRQWNDYLNWICKHLSTPSVAWDNTGIHRIMGHVVFKREPYMSVDYMIVTDNNETCVCIVRLDLQAKEYRLEIPTESIPTFDDVDVIVPRYDIPMNITGDREAVGTSSNDYGADYVSETKRRQKIRITESEVRQMVSECISRIISEQRKKVGKYTIVDGDYL